MSRLILHKVNGSPPARAVMMLGDIIGIKFEYKEPNLIKLEHYSSEYTEMNPMRTVPVLEDGDFILADSHAISTYLLNKYGGEKKEQLYPSEFKRRALVDQRLHFDTGFLFPRLSIIAIPTIKGIMDGPNEEHLKDIENAYEILEHYLRKTKYLALNEFTVADVCAGATVTTHEKLVPIDGDKYPNTKNWIERLKIMPCFIKINSPGVEQLVNIMRKCWERNKRYKQK